MPARNFVNTMRLAAIILAALLPAVVSAACPMNLQPILDQIRLDQEVPGISVVVARRDEILFAGASGVANLETGRPMTPDTVLYAGSLSKLFTVVLTLQLAEQSDLSLDDVVAGIANASAGEEVTVRHLLTHSSGLAREGNFDYWFNAQFPDKTALADYLRDTRLQTRPGSSINYSNIGYAALGPVIERASDQSYDEALSSRVLGPLGMNISGSLEPDRDLSAGYSPLNTVIPNEERPFAGLGRRVGKRRVREYHNANAMTPAFGIFSSAHDLSRLARFLQGYGGNEVLSVAMRREMLSPQAGGRGYGIRLGQYKGRAVAQHGGWFAAHRSYLFLDLVSGISVVVMSNSDSASPGDIAEAIFDGVLDNDSG